MKLEITDPQYEGKLLLMQKLSEVMDPELGLNIIDLGLVYDIEIDNESKVISIIMTLSTPACPAGGFIKGNVELVARESYPDFTIAITLTFEPRWSSAMVSEAGRQALGWQS